MATATYSKKDIMRLADFAGAVKLSEKDGQQFLDVQVMRVGAWDHPYYGVMLISPSTLSDMVKNFKDNVRRQDLPTDFFHESDREASGWFTDLYTLNDGKELWGKVKPTPKLLKMLADGEVRYFSADFYFEWTDPETNVSYKNVLNGGGFVNRPFIKGMQPVAELSEGGTLKMKTVEQLNEEIKALGEKHGEEVKKLGEQIAAKDAEIVELKAEKAKLLSEKETAAKEAKFAKMLSEGKACAAQKEAYMSGDMDKFMELAQPLNVAPKGGEGGEGSKRQLSDEEKAACKALGLSEEDYLKYNK